MAKARKRARAREVHLYVGTRKGGFLFRSDLRRKSWKVEGPFFAGWEVNHLVRDPRSAAGEFIGRARLGVVARGCLIAAWPEANVLISRRYDAGSGEPDYNAEVTLEKLLG